MFTKWVLLCMSALLVITACSPVYNQTEANVADVKLRAQAARVKSDVDAVSTRPLVVKRGMYVDTTPTSLARHPGWLNSRIVIRGDQLPFSYYTRVISAGAGSKILTKYQTGLEVSLPISISYSGTVRGALDLIAAKTGYVYNIKYNSIFWQAFITRSYDIAFMPGSSDYLMGKSSTTNAGTVNTSQAGTMTQVSNYVSSDESNSEYSSLKGTLSIWKDLEDTIKQLLSPDGKVMVSESTTSVTVRDRPSNVAVIGQYIANLNHNLSKQVLVKIQVLEVDLENDYNFGINWQIVANAFHNSAFVINESLGTPISITAFTPQQGVATLGTSAPTFPQLGVQSHVLPGKNPIPSYTILFNALNQQGKTSIVTEPRVVCLNNQVGVVRIVNQQGYLASVQNTSLSSSSTTNVGVGTVTSQLTPGTLITGLTLYILPKILKDSIYLQVNADLSNQNGPLTKVSSGSDTNPNNTFIQVPNITEKHFNQRSVIKSGETLILAGFRQVSNTANANQFLTIQALGGKGSQQLNKETIVLITPIILPGTGTT